MRASKEVHHASACAYAVGKMDRVAKSSVSNTHTERDPAYARAVLRDTFKLKQFLVTGRDAGRPAHINALTVLRVLAHVHSPDKVGRRGVCAHKWGVVRVTCRFFFGCEHDRARTKQGFERGIMQAEAISKCDACVVDVGCHAMVWIAARAATANAQCRVMAEARSEA